MRSRHNKKPIDWNLIGSLPEDILFTIISYLSLRATLNLSFTSKTLYEIVNTYLLKDIEKLFGSYPVPDSEIVATIKFVPGVEDDAWDLKSTIPYAVMSALNANNEILLDRVMVGKKGTKKELFFYVNALKAGKTPFINKLESFYPNKAVLEYSLEYPGTLFSSPAGPAIMAKLIKEKPKVRDEDLYFDAAHRLGLPYY